ncbi:hypothetical protein EV681_1319 [Advenella incenata]|jgi:hypothetical protein|uniref:Uncharacterized protein n=1 Tax=Advenella incenata TaxID=267800 RepID=A0A4Q7VSJ6_9BURK|nr:hypothetical protein EV681_1319 [Advenella incenata]
MAIAIKGSKPTGKRLRSAHDTACKGSSAALRGPFFYRVAVMSSTARLHMTTRTGTIALAISPAIAITYALFRTLHI